MRDAWLEDKIATTKKLGLTALAGLAAIIIGVALREELFKILLIFIGIILIIPFFFHESVLTIWHWKRRYRGEHSDLWGAILVVETSGWFKIIYWFRHIFPDWKGTGRYSNQS
jgi:hypothetical protein